MVMTNILNLILFASFNIKNSSFKCVGRYMAYKPIHYYDL